MPDDNSTQRVTAAASPREWRSAGWRLRVARLLRGRGLVRLRSSIGLRLALLALALGLPFVVYVGVNAARQASTAREFAQQRTLALARVVAARVDDVVGDNLIALALVRHGVTLDPSATSANDAFLDKIRGDLPGMVQNVGVWTLDGRNVGMLNRTSANAGRSIADRDYFRRAVQTSKTAIEGPLASDDDGNPVVAFARPVIGATGAVAGVVTLAIDLKQVQRHLDLGGAVPRGTVISIVNADGVVLARSVDPDRWIGMSVLAVGKARQHLASREGVDETVGADNVPRIAGYTQAKRTPWHVFVGMPADAALSIARTNRFETLALGALSLLLGIGFAARLGVRIARPLHRLAYDATLLARGNLAHRTSIGGDDETGVLASTLNRLAQTVEERTRALQEKTGALEEKTTALERSRSELATITANVPVLIAYIDAGERFRFVNEYYRDVFGASPERVVGHRLRAVLHPTVYARLESRMRDVRAGMPQTFETTFAGDGRGPVFMVTCFPDYGDGHEVRGAYVVCQDITRRKDAEEALAGRERFVRLIADGIPARITYIDTSNRLLFGNRRFAEYWGREPADIVGRPLADVVSSAAYAQIKPELDRSYAGLARRFDLVVDRANGTEFYQVDHVPDIDAAGVVHGVVTISQDVTALRQAKQALAASEKRMRTVADNLPALIAYLDAGERYLFVNARSQQMFGLSPEAMLGQRAQDVLSPETYAQSKPHLERACRGERARFQRTVVRNGRACHELVELIPDQEASGRVLGLYALVQDITDLRTAQAKAEESEERLRSMTDSMPSMVGYIDCDRCYRFNNRYYETWLGRPLTEITGRRVADVLGPRAYENVAPNLDRAFAGERVDFDVEVPGPEGSRFVRGSYIPDIDASGAVLGVYTSSTDITPLKEVERQLERLAQRDTLTGLPNRHAFNDGIAAALRRSQRAATPVALLFLDVDGFKQINDTLGHAAGDEVLREFARRLSASVRATDLVARLAGDEFVIVLEGVHTREECRFVARKIIAAMRPEFDAGEAAVKVTTSIGVALGQGGETTPEALLKRADSALYAAKGHGRDRYEIAI
ncbi:MAG TPA: PAS domain-containing protein [Casimicrobiaceae bacterium]|nr:PAS domain-containing protein [Casimicrobiaceae bacterium]